MFTSYDSEEFKVFTSVATELRSDYEFKHTLDASFLPTKETTLTGPVIRLFKKFDEGFNDLKVNVLICTLLWLLCTFRYAVFGAPMSGCYDIFDFVITSDNDALTN